MPSKYSAPKAQAMQAPKVKDQFDHLICNCCSGGISTFVASVLCPCAVLGSNAAMVQTGGRDGRVDEKETEMTSIGLLEKIENQSSFQYF